MADQPKVFPHTPTVYKRMSVRSRANLVRLEAWEYNLQSKQAESVRAVQNARPNRNLPQLVNADALPQFGATYGAVGAPSIPPIVPTLMQTEATHVYPGFPTEGSRFIGRIPQQVYERVYRETVKFRTVPATQRIGQNLRIGNIGGVRLAEILAERKWFASKDSALDYIVTHVRHSDFPFFLNAVNHMHAHMEEVMPRQNRLTISFPALGSYRPEEVTILGRRVHLLSDMAKRIRHLIVTGSTPNVTPSHVLYQILIRHRTENDRRTLSGGTGMITTEGQPYLNTISPFQYDPVNHLMSFLVERSLRYVPDIDWDAENTMDEDVSVGRPEDDNLRAVIDAEIIEFNFMTDLDNIIIPRGIIASKTRPKTALMANKKWLQLSDDSRTNCFFNSFATCLFWKKNRRYLSSSSMRIKGGEDLKRKIIKYYNDNNYEPGKKRSSKSFEFATEKIMEAAASHKKCKIRLYNMLYENFKTILPNLDINEEVHILIMNQTHAAALIERKAIKALGIDIEDPEHVVGEIGTLKVYTTAPKLRPDGKLRAKFDKYTVEGMDNGWFIIAGKKYTFIEDFIKEKGYKHGHEFVTFEEQDKDELIDKRNAKKVVHENPIPRLLTGDLEATEDEQGRFVTYASGLLHKPKDGEMKVMQFYGLDCLQKTFKFMHDNIADYAGRTIYYHNGSKFDFYLLLRGYLFSNTDLFTLDCADSAFIEASGKIMQFRIFSTSEKHDPICFKDSCLLYPISLDKLTTDLKVKHKKLTDTVDHFKITIDNYMTYFETLKPYLENDVLGLYEALEIQFKDIYERLQMDMTKYPTNSAFAINSFWIHNYDQNKYPLYKVKSSTDRFIRSGYFGGRNECVYIGIFKQGKYYYYDVTSLYPFVSCFDLPYGEPEWVQYHGEDIEDLDDRPFGFFEVEVWNEFESEEQEKKFTPLHGCKVQNGTTDRLIFPTIINPKFMVLFSEEIYYALDNNLPYKYKVHSLYKFKQGPWFKEFMEKGFEMKDKYSAEGKKGAAVVEKNKINGAYGRMALKTTDRDGIKIFSEEVPNFLPEYIYEKLINIATVGKYTAVRSLRDVPSRDFNVGAAAAITSYARIHLYKIITAIKAKGYRVFYYDTDSVITDMDMEDPTNKDFMTEFCWDGKGKALGTLKNEADEVVGIPCGDPTNPKKTYYDLWKKPNKAIYFDTLIIAGAKMYYIGITLPDGKQKVKTAFKGVSRSKAPDLEQFKSLIENEALHMFPDAGNIGNEYVEFLDSENKVIAKADMEGNPIEIDEKGNIIELEWEDGVDEDVEPSEKRQRIVYTHGKTGQLKFKSGKQLLMSSDNKDSVKALYKSMKFKLNYTKGTMRHKPSKAKDKITYVAPLVI